jgi:hypothetical protein
VEAVESVAWLLTKERIMPVTYNVQNDGHFIQAVASRPLTDLEFVEYEVAHATDPRITPPVDELLEVEVGALENITKEDISAILERRKQIPSPPTPHRCAIVVSGVDARDWEMARFYEGMVTLHYPENVIVFGDARIARIWLGIEPPATANADMTKEQGSPV